MITKLGLAAGDIWNYLDAHSRRSHLKDIVVALQKDRDLVLMAVGWLAREGHIVVHGDGPDYIIELSH